MFANRPPVLGVAFSCLAFGVFGSPTPGRGSDSGSLQARAWLGGVDVNLACQIQNGDGWTSQKNDNGCDGWVCIMDGKTASVNMDVACVTQYYLNQAYAKCKGGVYDWACYL
ncbi:hypothetical protein CGRA01v4_06120 [Colletotrichum graminicola]|uniref:Secreted protein n=1 Tax=Colletotrichum graminicola (strain M1.001 / M2 / FGSC 10212) TaxID=645133 RepID=E3R0Z2_COLGM|nr:uncharacterized protein GLRG_11928 [Colletotrichum graminicola M1.001]EFQ36780.1 hypothetical protein GLRG_11928 [Colletotrichum graminicola M1.001]WDK14839.1 hypothetical protein CGRA01v4_06120 [Colletotrichum graminicola]